MSKKNVLITILLLFLLSTSVIIYILFLRVQGEHPLEAVRQKAKGIMVLIEFKDTVGLKQFTNSMEERNIEGLLMVTPEFVKDNCSDIKQVMERGVEIVASNVDGPFWDVPYEDEEKVLNICG